MVIGQWNTNLLINKEVVESVLDTILGNIKVVAVIKKYLRCEKVHIIYLNLLII